MRLIQAFIAILAFVGYVVYQLVIRKKKMADLQNDVLAIGFFVLVWMGIYYWMK